jgi:hypothetical protein
VLAAAARQHPNVVLADWQHTIRHRTHLLWDDGIHPRPSGGRVYARMIKAAVQAAQGAAGPAAAAGRLPVPFLRIGEAGRQPARLAP